MAMTVAVGSCTSVGRTRTSNQDWLGYFGASDDGPAKGRLFILADGMGGEAGGEVASRLAVDVIAKAYFEHPSEEPPAGSPKSSGAQSTSLLFGRELTASRRYEPASPWPSLLWYAPPRGLERSAWAPFHPAGGPPFLRSQTR